MKDAYGAPLVSFHDRVNAEGVGYMGFAPSRRADDNNAAGFLQPIGIELFHEFVSGYLRIEGPVEVLQSFHSFDPRQFQQLFDSPFLPRMVFRGKELLDYSEVLFGQG